MSNLTRPLTVVRRRPNLMDVLIPKNPATAGYRLLAAPNFDQVFTEILTAPISSGYLDRNLILAGKHLTLQALNNRDHIRVTFDPQTFNAVAGITDSAQFWLTFQPVDFAGNPGTESARMLVLPEDKLRGDSVVQIAGTAPQGAAVANAMQLLLPFRSQNMVIRNHETATVLMVALEPNGPEALVTGTNSSSSTMELRMGAQGGLLVRGVGGTAAFSATFTSFLPL